MSASRLPFTEFLPVFPKLTYRSKTENRVSISTASKMTPSVLKQTKSTQNTWTRTPKVRVRPIVFFLKGEFCLYWMLLFLVGGYWAAGTTPWFSSSASPTSMIFWFLVLFLLCKPELHHHLLATEIIYEQKQCRERQLDCSNDVSA